MKIEKYKPKKYNNKMFSIEDSESDYYMECDICRASPKQTKFYFIIKGENHSSQWCEKCFKLVKKFCVKIK